MPEPDSVRKMQDVPPCSRPPTRPPTLPLTRKRQRRISSQRKIDTGGPFFFFFFFFLLFKRPFSRNNSSTVSLAHQIVLHLTGTVGGIDAVQRSLLLLSLIRFPPSQSTGLVCRDAKTQSKVRRLVSALHLQAQSGTQG